MKCPERNRDVRPGLERARPQVSLLAEALAYRSGPPRSAGWLPAGTATEMGLWAWWINLRSRLVATAEGVLAVNP